MDIEEQTRKQYSEQSLNWLLQAKEGWIAEYESTEVEIQKLTERKQFIGTMIQITKDTIESKSNE